MNVQICVVLERFMVVEGVLVVAGIQMVSNEVCSKIIKETNKVTCEKITDIVICVNLFFFSPK